MRSVPYLPVLAEKAGLLWGRLSLVPAALQLTRVAVSQSRFSRVDFSSRISTLKLLERPP